MFARVFALLPLALLVSASHLEARDSCSTGTMSCCNSLQSVDDSHEWLAKRDLLDVVAGVTGLIGLDCSPIDVLAVGGNSCTQQVACCDGTQFNGLVNVGCSPINVNL